MVDEDRLAELLLRWEDAWEHGEDLPARELCANCPALAEPLQERIDALKRTAWMNQECDDLDDPSEGLAPGTLLAGRYRIEQMLGEGGFGQVYRAVDEELQREVAVKVSHRQGPENRPDQLIEEARRLAQLHHPGIVAIHDVGRHEGRYFLVADLIEGTNLAERIATARPSPLEAARLIARVAEALHSAHEQGFIHRDIKPANILLDKFDRPLVADFGIATTISELDGATSGTLPYMAPEQIAGEVQLIDRRTDVYALGVVLYELLTGELPYKGRTPVALREQILLKAPLSIRVSGGKVPAELERVCLWCLQKHPSDRPKNANDLAEALWACTTAQQRWRIPLVLLVIAVLSMAGLALLGLLPEISPWAVPATKATQGAFVFDGTNRIVTPVEQFAPVTLEAWVRPMRYEQRCHFVIGSDIPTEHGIGLGMAGVLLGCEYVPGFYQTMQVVPLREWSHLAAVFGEKETRLFFNGKLVGTGPATQVKGGTPFVIGNVGYGNPLDYFVGEIRAVRISRGERYQGDFTPEPEFSRDAESVLIYDGRFVEDGKIVDLSGNGNHGTPQPSLP